MEKCRTEIGKKKKKIRRVEKKGKTEIGQKKKEKKWKKSREERKRGRKKERKYEFSLLDVEGTSI